MTKVLYCFVIVFCVTACKSDRQHEPSHSLESKNTPIGMAYIPRGTYMQGGKSDQSLRNELPRHEVSVSPFFMDVTEVTNGQYQKFVTATDYQTVAERQIDWEMLKEQVPPGTTPPPDSLLQPGALVFKSTSGPVNLNRYDLWWEWTLGADWKHPYGKDSDISAKQSHPVVHIAYEDAVAYCQWQDKRLPTESEWEWAASNGDDSMKYPWGNGQIEDASDKANFWQGIFPYKNTLKDGYAGTAPVKSYPANSYGLYDMGGNVWEWCADRFSSDYYATLEGNSSRSNPQGPTVSRDAENPYSQNAYVIKGGSFLCNDDYCSGYRVARRLGKDADSGSNHTGFRCVMDVKPSS